MASGLSYQPPERFTFSKPEGWHSWIKRFERYRIVLTLGLKKEKRQVSSLIYSMEEETEDILESSRLSDEERKSYKTVTGKFEWFFMKKRNSFWPDKLLSKKDKKRESQLHLLSMTYIYALVKHCNFGDLHDEMVRDILIASIHKKEYLNDYSWMVILLWERL